MTDKLIEELIEKLRGHIRWHVEADVHACDMTDQELRDVIVTGVMPIIRRREIEADKKVKDEATARCAYSLVNEGYLPLSDNPLRKPTPEELAVYVAAIDVAAIVGGEAIRV